jgi:hypothetical protein
VIDDYVTREGHHHYREIAALDRAAVAQNCRRSNVTVSRTTAGEGWYRRWCRCRKHRCCGVLVGVEACGPVECPPTGNAGWSRLWPTAFSWSAMPLRPLEDEMTEAPALPFLGRVGSDRPAAGSPRRSPLLDPRVDPRRADLRPANRRLEVSAFPCTSTEV